jgi:hypothetical protein
MECPVPLHVEELWKTGIRETARRLAANKPALITPAALIAAWLLYLAATVRLCFSSRTPDRPPLGEKNSIELH